MSLVGSVVAGAMSLAACATPEAARDPGDPFEPINRAFFRSTIVTEKAVLRPVAVAYRAVVPEPARDSVRNFLRNLGSPVVFVNDVLQGEFDRAGTTLLRTGINTTIGVAGLFDVAGSWGHPYHSEDFGQTLGVYGVGDGPYIFVPLLGPSNPRDLLGGIVDFFSDPLTYVQWGDDYVFVPYARVGLDTLDTYQRSIQTLDDIENSSVDFYASMRSLYRQSRNNEIMNGETPIEDLPDF